MSLVDIGTNEMNKPMPNNHDVLKEKPADGTHFMVPKGQCDIRTKTSY